jgi:lysophospholipase L1-like esterase
MTGMVNQLAGYGGATEADLAFARAYLADGDMDPEILALRADPDRQAERRRIQEQRRADNWPALGHYRAANAALAGQQVEAVFIGDSITEMWAVAQPDFFSNGVVNRGVSGQTSPQILLRFMADVVALRPRAVHLMCGVNDIAGNTGPTTPDDFRNNIYAMVDLARANAIAVILGGLAPVTALPWADGVANPRSRVLELNRWLEALAADQGLSYADYFTALADAKGTFRSDLTRDGLHPRRQAYALMRTVVAPHLRRVASGRSRSPL